MSRPLRIEFEGALYHIRARGNEQEFGKVPRVQKKLSRSNLFITAIIIQTRMKLMRWSTVVEISRSRKWAHFLERGVARSLGE